MNELLERRPSINTAADLLGPGLGPQAVFISDWNGDETAFNGIFYSDVGAQNSPDSARRWMGMSMVDANGNGYQRIVEYNSDDPELFAAWPGVVYSRAFSSTDGVTRTYSVWRFESGAVEAFISGLTNITTTTPTQVIATNLDVASTDQRWVANLTLDITHNSNGTQSMTATILADGVTEKSVVWHAQGVNNARIPVCMTTLISGVAPGVRTFEVQCSLSGTLDSYQIHTGSSLLLHRIV